MIVVEPQEGLPYVDREFYIGQNETHTKERPGSPSGVPEFNDERLLNETAMYVMFNGAYNALTAKRFGAMKAKVRETVRVFMVNGGRNLRSSCQRAREKAVRRFDQIPGDNPIPRIPRTAGDVVDRRFMIDLG